MNATHQRREPSDRRLEQLRARIEPLRDRLLAHSIYRDLHDIATLRVFMEHHVFAVWDFMSLLKSLQQRLCCNSVPWVPSGQTLGSRFVNEIVLGEESDEDGEGGHASHFDLYRRAMLRCGADASQIDRLLEALRSGHSIQTGLRDAEIPDAIRLFVLHTFAVIEGGDLCRIAATFTFGREDLLPGVFQRIVDEIGESFGDGLNDFKYYLLRHIDLDGDEHGPMAARLMAVVCGEDDDRWRRAEEAAVEALEARIAFWNAIHEQVRERRLAAARRTA
jgi:hypothetical protein